MDHFERMYALHKILRSRKTPIDAATLKERLGNCSKATLYRTIADLRDGLGAPIVNERERGWRYDPDADIYELPGLWLNSSEIHALLAFRTLLHDIQPGLLDSEIEPIRQRIEKLLAGHAVGAGELEQRIRILGMAVRPTGKCFQTCATALVERKQLQIDYHGRARNAVTHRQISPQRLAHYRDNWYLDAWCHEAKALRSFAVERIQSARMLDKAAKAVTDSQLDRHFATSYGIFAGKPKHTAVLRFSAERARWVADERWHPNQKGKFLADGRYELRVPYGEPTELLMDILKHGPDVEVMRPDELRNAVAGKLQAALARYSSATEAQAG